MNSLAATLLRQGRYAEAEKLYRQAFDLQRRVLGPENPHTLATMGSLGWTIAQEGRYAEAEKFEREAFEIERRVQGPEHQDTLISMNALVAILRVENPALMLEYPLLRPGTRGYEVPESFDSCACALTLRSLRGLVLRNAHSGAE